MANYNVGNKVKITNDKEIIGENDALQPYLGKTVTIATVDEDGVYTVEEIDGIEISNIDIEEVVDINFTKWVEEAVCPCCGGRNYSDEPYYETTEVFRDFTCNDCESEWSERYNLTLVTANDIDFAITSESEDRLQTQNNQLKTFIKNLGYNEHQISMICNNKGDDVRLDLKCLSLRLNDEAFDINIYEKNDTIEANFLIGKDLVNVRVTSNNVIANVLSDKITHQDTIDFMDEITDCDARRFLLDKYQEAKYPFLHDSEIDKDLLKEWATSNMIFGDFFTLIINNKYIKIQNNNGEIICTEYNTMLDACYEISEKSETIETNKYPYYWIDPEFKSQNADIFASGLCEIVDYPLLAMIFKCYSKLEYKDYNHDKEDGRYGLEVGEFDINGDCLDSFENSWFETEEQREEYIKSLGLLNLEEVIKEEFYNNPKIYRDLRNYCEDAIFEITTIHGSEAEVSKSELWQLVEIEAAGKYGLFVNIEENGINHSPALVSGSMSPYFQDFTLIDKEYRNLPIEQLATFAFLQTIYTEDRLSFDFDGNDEIEAFHAHIVSFKFDTDNSIIATLVDMEGNRFDVSWEEIKNSEFMEE